MEEMDCCLIPGSDSPTKVIFAVPFDVSYSREGKRQRIKFVAKVQFSISSLVTNAVTQVQSKVEALSPFDFPDLLQSISSIGMTEQITDYIERVTDNIRSFFEKTERAKQLKKEFVNAMMDTFHNHLLEFDAVNYSFTSFIFTISKDKARQEPPSTAIATFYLSDRFPNEYPKLTLAVPMVPGSTYKPTPSPEVIPISRYSPRWGVDRIVTEIWEQLWDEIPRFHAKMTHAMSNA
ncbi:hypothetical protein BCR41DRAFT_19204 [Lobosporangium transversale]|uniref:BRISC and BRCA1-A complex member 2 n=1 Tax=Lobosporangium transversale TaxID=64571 RepID=A0A1Y2FZF9_9FUNG|nr:hypothetical protein BCR41DRAFT_19204 [Lobosporangium transversale]ORY89585.1 hypothetical protein BCR41DRAFT_19204 [Lobosporangium transversale]|eukprot:XP_021875074.1 hypothetical protein BCR41DRAFT_19204 [Lobosporangium transversale]